MQHAPQPSPAPPTGAPAAAADSDGEGARPPIVVRPCASFADCTAVAALCGQEFWEECHGQGLSVQKWVEIEAEDLQNRPSWWPAIGLAVEGERLLGVVVLTLENEEDDSISWSEYSRRVGCGPTILSMLYDRVLDEPLQEHECLIDFIAVSPEARGRGVGARLMAWAEAAGATILADTEAAAVAAHGVDMTLWVAADNAAALRLYQRSGYSVVRRTDEGACHCMASRVLQRFLGHPVWVKMHKQLPAPAHLATRKPEQLSIQLVASAAPAPATAAAAAEGGLEEVPLGTAPLPQLQHPDKVAVGCAGSWQSPGWQPRPAGEGEAPAVPDSPARRLLHKLSHGLFAPSGEALPPQGSPRTAGAPSGSQGPTPRIAAVGAAAAAGFGPAAPEPERAAGASTRRASEGTCLRASTNKEGGGYSQLSVHAAPSVDRQSGAGARPRAASSSRARSASASTGTSTASVNGAALPRPGSVASVSVGSAPSVAGDSKGEGESYRAAYTRAAAAGPDVFEVVELSSGSTNAAHA